MKRNSARHAFLISSTSSLIFIVVTLCASAQSPQAAKPVTKNSTLTTFTRDIAPIVFRSCAPCHHPGEAGPFSLVTYGDAKSHARQIVDVTRKRLMPPWLPSADSLRFDEDAHLSDHDIALFQQWLDDGLREGVPDGSSASPTSSCTPRRLTPCPPAVATSTGILFSARR
jgi:hypothetical protein